MPARKRARTPKVELLPPDDPPQSKGRKTLVEAEHTIKYSAPVPVTVEEEPEPEIEELEFGEELEEKPGRRRRSSATEREELRRQMDKQGVVPTSRLKLTIEKYAHSDVDDSGTLAQKDFCTKYAVTRDHILNDDYPDVARTYGPGRYWFTLRLDNRVVTQWERKISGSVTPAGAIENGAASSNGDAPQQPIGIVDPIKQLRESARMYKELKEAFETEPAISQAQAPLDPKVAALQMIAENPDVMEKIGKGIASTVLGVRGGGDEDPWAAVALEAIKSGQAANIAATIIREIMAPFQNMRANNEQPQNGAPPMPPRPQPPQVVPVNNQAPPQAVQEQPPQLNEADALVISLIKACEQKAPAQDAVNIINVACYRTPELGESVDALINMSPESLLAMLAAYHPDVAKWEHAKQWLKDLTDALTAGEEAGE